MQLISKGANDSNAVRLPSHPLARRYLAVFIMRRENFYFIRTHSSRKQRRALLSSVNYPPTKWIVKNLAGADQTHDRVLIKTGWDHDGLKIFISYLDALSARA